MSTPMSMRWPGPWRGPSDASRALVLALALSAVLHVLVVAASFGSSGRSGKTGPDPGPLRATLTVPDASASLEMLPVPVPMALPPPVHPTLATLSLPLLAPANTDTAPANSRSGREGEGSGIGHATGVLLVSRARLGALHERGQNEYPIEIDRPPRIDGEILARYPAAALAAGREDSVVAWVVVNEQGKASDIEIAEGTDEFAEQVRAALRTAHFVPAEDKLRPIRFPIALQFDFRAGAPATAAADAAAAAK